MTADFEAPPHHENKVRIRCGGAEPVTALPDPPFRGGGGAEVRMRPSADFGVRKTEHETQPDESMTSTSRIVAIDIGRSGALALFDAAGQLLNLADMPVLADGPACRPTVNGPLLAALIRRWAPSSAVCEHVAARPGEAPSGSFAFGRSRGIIEGVLADQAVPVRFVTPAWWKRRVGIPPGRDMKDTARSAAIARWPDRAELFARKLDHDRAEAALIGLAYIEEQRR